MTRVRKVAAVSLMTPLAAAAIAAGLSQPANALEACPPLASATIQAPTGTVTAGERVHVSAQISGLMLLEAHLQITGPGLNQQVGDNVISGSINGDVVVPQTGDYLLAVVGNGTKCAYQTAKFSVAPSPAGSKGHRGSTGKSQLGAGRNGSNGAAPLPSGTPGARSTGDGSFPLNPLNGASPFSLPQVAPDGSVQGFAYPTPDPQVASPPSAQPMARNVSDSTPISWGQSLAIALVLLVISAHLGMWSRRQRLAAEGVGSTGGNGSGRRSRGKKSRKSDAMMAATATASADTEIMDAGDAVATDPFMSGSTATRPAMTDAATTGFAAEPPAAMSFATSDWDTGDAFAGALGDTFAFGDRAIADDASATRDEDSHRARRGGRGYQGRRRRS